MKIDLRKCGETLVVSLPLEFAAQLGWESGDVCECAVEGDALRIVRTEAKHDRAMRIAREGMDKYREVFEKLAKT